MVGFRVQVEVGERMGQQKTAVFIDDDLDFLTLLEYKIRHPLFDVVTCHETEGYHAVNEILETKPDIIFIDFKIPKATGGQIIPVVQAIPHLQNIPIYIITGFPENVVKTFLKAPVNGILFKGDNLSLKILNILDETVTVTAAI